MKAVVVDASVVLAGLFKDGVVRDTLLSTDSLRFVAPSYIKDEAGRHSAEVARRSRLALPTVDAVLEDLLSALELVPPGIYAGLLPEARDLARAADALPDTEYVALALALNAPVWTLDKDFPRIRAITTLNTREVVELGT